MTRRQSLLLSLLPPLAALLIAAAGAQAASTPSLAGLETGVGRSTPLTPALVRPDSPRPGITPPVAAHGYDRIAPATGVAAEAGGEGVTPLYRAVNAAERDNAIESQLFTQGPNSMEGKWFAEHAKHAGEWGRWFYRNEPFHILETKVPSGYAQSLHFEPNLDSIGPARYVKDLDELNRLHLGIREYTP